jgi:hypothetical protein
MTPRLEPQSRFVKILQWAFLAIWVVSTTVLWYHYAGTRPKIPRPETGNIYELNTHGSYAYLTFSDCVRLYGTMGVGFGGNLALYIVYLWRRGWVAP